MCGIFLLLNHSTHATPSYDANGNYSHICNEFMKGRNRGPENSKLEILDDNTIFGFHRLAINGLNDESNQPLCVNDCVLICNGEIYNYKNLYDILSIDPSTNSDCEVIIHLYLKYGIEQTLIMLDGVFSFALYDRKNDLLHISRDPYGIRSLFMYYDNQTIAFASEAKSLVQLFPLLNQNRYVYYFDEYVIQQFNPGHLLTLQKAYNKKWCQIYRCQYHKPNFSYKFVSYESSNESAYFPHISNYLNMAVIKRCQTTERPIACLLSGGLDSSLITALVVNYLKENCIQKPMETYSIGLKGATDLKYAKLVADYLGTNHTEVIVTEKEMFDAIPSVIYATETYDTTTVRASIGNYLVAKYISNNSEAKVVFNGDGSDELFGGYLYMKKCPDDIEFDKETRRLLENIHYYDVLRSDKSISSNGLEPRTPFLDKTFVNYCLSIPAHIRNHNNVDVMEKYLLRKSFSSEYFLNCGGNPLLPDEILWRSKEAFSDGVSSTELSLFDILQKHICDELKINYGNQHLTSDSIEVAFPQNVETEKNYYRSIFNQYFPNCNHIIPTYWMPKYSDSAKNDPSARTLTHYET